MKLHRIFAAAWPLFAVTSAIDRTVMENTLGWFLNQLSDNDPGRVPVVPNVKYVENSQILPFPSGLWRVAGKLGKYRHVFADPENNQVAAITTLTENGVPLIYIIRLKFNKYTEIQEIETQITRDSTGAARYENMTKPEAVWLETVPVEKRISRAKLIEQTNRYYTGMERNDPKGNYSFFDKECNRLEDGLQTTNQKNGDPYGHSNDTAFASLGCEAQFQTGFLGFVTKIRDRRYDVVDEERQAVVAFTIFDHNGTVRELPSVNGTSNPIPPYFDVPRTLAATEAFRLRGDKLYRIEMTLTEVPYGQRTAFNASPQIDLRGKGTNSTISNPDALLDQVLQAMLKNDTTSLPLAKGIRYSENGQFLALGDGLWETLQEAAKPGKDAYAARFVDSASGTIGYWGVTKEQTTPGVLGLRIQTAQGKITEIEAISVRAEYSGPRGGTNTLMRPPLPIEWNATTPGSLDPVFQAQQNRTGTGTPNNTLASIVNAYFDGLEKHSSTNVQFKPSCTRRDNLRQANTTCASQIEGKGDAPNGLYNHTTSIRDRRILVSDTSRGVVLAVAMVDNPANATGPLPMTEKVPSTYMVPQLIKIEAGSISKIESMIKWMPFGYASAWSEEKVQ